MLASKTSIQPCLMPRSIRSTHLAVLSLLLAACQSTDSSREYAWGSDSTKPLAPVAQGEPALLTESTSPSEPPAPTTIALPLSERNANIYRKMGLRVGGVAYGSFDTTVQVNSASGLGAVLDMEDLLGLSSSANVVRADAFYAFNDFHRIDFAFYDISRSGSRTLTDDVQFGDTTISAGDTESTFKTQIFKLDYRYNCVTDARTVLAASFGFHVMRIQFGLKSATFNEEGDFKVTAPLPVLGLHGAYSLADKWSLYASGEVFQIQVDEFGGTLSDFRLGLNWDFSKHVGLGLEMNTFNMGAAVEDGTLEAEVEYGYSGIGIYLRGYL
jgi:hypothetical protein